MGAENRDYSLQKIHKKVIQAPHFFMSKGPDQ